MPGKSKFQISRSLDERIKRIIAGSVEQDSEFAQVSNAFILGFNYGNVTNCVGLTTNYELHHAVFPVVGLVFFKTSPSDEEIKSSLKTVKEYSSSPNGLGSFNPDKNEHLFLVYNADRDSGEVEKRIFNFTKGTFVRRRRLRLNVLDDPYCPRQLPRGSEDLFNLDDGDSMTSAEGDHVDHLIFFIHGVGGVCDVRFRSCVEVVADFRKMANSLLAQHSPSSSGASTPSNSHLAENLKKGIFRKRSTESSTSPCSEMSEVTKSGTNRVRKVECLPISWHSCTRRQIGINEQLNLIALSSVPKLRHFLHKVVLDALLYASGPVYSQTIINNVGDEINRLYTLFMEKHPNFNGSVSLAGHSLGSVIVFDLLANQIPPEAEQVNVNNNNGEECKAQSTIPRQACVNVGHRHHDLTEQTEFRYCSDYRNLEELLKDLDLTQYAELFHKEHIDINTLLLLTDTDMRELKLSVGARRKLGTYINFKKVSRIPVSNGTLQNTEGKQSTSSETKRNGNNLLHNMNTGQYLIKYPQLRFKPRCFFAFGSPMPMFLNVRGIQDFNPDYKLPTCDRMFNIFHPYDPLAYRIEPLIDPRFKNVEPVQVPHHRGGKRIHVQLREGFARVGHDIKHRLLGSLRDTWSSFTRFGTTPLEPTVSGSTESSAESRKRLTKSVSSSVDVEVESFDTANEDFLPRKQLKRQQVVRSHSDLNISSLDSIIENSLKHSLDSDGELDPDAQILNTHLKTLKLDEERAAADTRSKKKGKKNIDKTSKEEVSDFDTSKIGRLNGGSRIDYVLQEKPIELFNEYIFAFTSHANYWQNEDSALMILNEIYQVDNVQIFDCCE